MCQATAFLKSKNMFSFWHIHYSTRTCNWMLTVVCCGAGAAARTIRCWRRSTACYVTTPRRTHAATNSQPWHATRCRLQRCTAYRWRRWSPTARSGGPTITRRPCSRSSPPSSRNSANRFSPTTSNDLPPPTSSLSSKNNCSKESSSISVKDRTQIRRIAESWWSLSGTINN